MFRSKVFQKTRFSSSSQNENACPFVCGFVCIHECIKVPFTIVDSVYGSPFYMATGFHRNHVLIGTTFILVCLLRHLNNHFSKSHHFGFEAAA